MSGLDSLLPCPFCGGVPKRTGEAMYCAVQCACGASVGFVVSRDASEVDAAWNRRAELSRRAEGVEPVAWTSQSSLDGMNSDDQCFIGIMGRMQTEIACIPLYAHPAPAADKGMVVVAEAELQRLREDSEDADYLQSVNKVVGPYRAARLLAAATAPSVGGEE